MTDQPKKRRFWQLHLSTAVLLMFAAGALMLASTTKKAKHPPLGGHEGAGPYIDEIVHVGWPFDAAFRYEPALPGWDTGASYMSDPWRLEQWGLALDIVVAVCVLSGVAVVSESIICQRRGGKRRWLPFYLSTLVVMIFLAGGMLSLNTWGNRSEFVEVVPVVPKPGAHQEVRHKIEYGFPWKCLNFYYENHYFWSKSGLILDVGVALALIGCVGGSFESILRRREGRKP